MAACFCTGACKTGDRRCSNSGGDYFKMISEVADKFNAPSESSYQQLGRKWVKVPITK